jgi:hypothetical protein
LNVLFFLLCHGFIFNCLLCKSERVSWNLILKHANFRIHSFCFMGFFFFAALLFFSWCATLQEFCGATLPYLLVRFGGN